MTDHGSYEFSDALEAAEAAALEQQIAEAEAEAAALDLELTGDPWEKRLGGWIWLALATIAVLIQGKHTWTPVQILVARCLAGWQPELVPGECPPALGDAIRRCCAVDPAARPRMADVRDELAALQDAADKW